jgi:serine/threonine-protein kinase
MVASLEEYLKQLISSGLMSAEEVHSLRASLPTESFRIGDAEMLTRELVRRRILTPYQATAIYQGKAKGLVLGNYVVLDKLGQGAWGLFTKASTGG